MPMAIAIEAPPKPNRISPISGGSSVASGAMKATANAVLVTSIARMNHFSCIRTSMSELL